MVFFEDDTKLFKKEFNLEITFRDDKKNLDLTDKNENFKIEPVIEKNTLLVSESHIFKDKDTYTKICYTRPLFVNVQKKEMLLGTDIYSIEEGIPDVEKKYYFQKKDIGWVRIEEESDNAKDLLSDYKAYEVAEMI